ncbi:MAG: universal stress protein [Halobacteriales archaeon]
MRFIVAVDGSDASDRALEYAIEVTDADRDALTLVHVVDPDVYAETPSEPLSGFSEAEEMLVASVEDAEERGERVLEAAAADADEHGVDAATETLYGDPATRLAEFADEQGFDGVFIGHKGRSERAARLVGSVAKALVERSEVPVTVVR